MAENNFIFLFFKFRDKPNCPEYTEALSYLYDIFNSYFSSKVFNLQEKEDLIQDVILSIHKARFSAMSQEKFYGFIYAIAKYKYIDLVRKQKCYRDNLKKIKATEQFFYFISLGEFDFSKILNKQECEVFSLQYLEGLSIHQITEELDLTLNSVKSSSYRARKKIKDCFL